MSDPKPAPKLIEDEIAATRELFDQMKADPAMSFERESEWAMQIIFKSTGKNEFKTRDAALDNLISLREAFLNVAAIGVTLNPARKLAYLLVRDKKIVYDLSYLGLVEIAVSVGAIRWAQADLVYAGDTFKRTGVDRAPHHEHDPFADDRGALKGAYVVAKLMDGDFLTTTMKVDEINAIKAKSYGAGSPHSPWNNHFGEMAKKTVIKRASKLWKVADGGMERLDKAIHYLNTDGGEGIDFLAAEAASAPAPSVTMPKAKAAPAPDSAERRQEGIEARSDEIEGQPAEREPGSDDDAPPASPAPAEAPASEAPSPAPASDGPPASPGAIKWLQGKGDALKAAMLETKIRTLDGLTDAQFKDLRAIIRKAA